MSYENAPATILLATHCCCCNRPLVDAESVTRGVGPDCAEKYGFNETIPEDARVQANAIVHRIAAEPKAATVEQDIAQLRDLGLVKLAERLVERLGEEPTVKIEVNTDGWYTVKTPYDARFVESLKLATTYADRRWDRASKTWTVAPGARAALWAALSAAFAGKIGVGPKGRFVVAANVEAKPASSAPTAETVSAAISEAHAIAETLSDSAEPPADCVREDGSIDCEKWMTRIEAEVSRADRAKAAATARAPVNLTAAHGSYSRDRAAADDLRRRGYRKNLHGAWYKPPRWIGGYNA